jgi:tripartite ATP-independent transporter DctM subunit
VSGAEAGAAGFALLLVLIAVRIPIAVAMMAVGLGGYALVNGVAPLLNYLKTGAFWTYHVYDLSVVPLFMLMSQFATKAELNEALFRAANVWLGHRRGGVAMATIGACAGFGAICGSSIATAVTMAPVALPELRRYRYSGALATGTLAAGGTLGILIPPSIVLVIYAIITEANIVTLFQAAMIPGILAALGYVVAIAVYVRLYPEAGPVGHPASARERWRGLVDIWPVLSIFLLVIGGIYIGWFTPTEGAAVGAFGTGLVAFTRGRMGLRDLVDTLVGTAIPTAAIFMVLLGSEFFSAFLGFTRMPQVAAELIGGSGLGPMAVLGVMIVLFIALGCIMDSLAMILVTMPVFWPIIAGLDFGLTGEDTKLWFGIITLIVVEIGLITPPVGLNVFIINSFAKDVPMTETFRGVIPFLASDAVRVGLLVAVPALTLTLPRLFN